MNFTPSACCRRPSAFGHSLPALRWDVDVGFGPDGNLHIHPQPPVRASPSTTNPAPHGFIGGLGRDQVPHHRGLDRDLPESRRGRADPAQPPIEPFLGMTQHAVVLRAGGVGVPRLGQRRGAFPDLVGIAGPGVLRHHVVQDVVVPVLRQRRDDVVKPHVARRNAVAILTDPPGQRRQRPPRISPAAPDPAPGAWHWPSGCCGRSWLSPGGRTPC